MGIIDGENGRKSTRRPANIDVENSACPGPPRVIATRKWPSGTWHTKNWIMRIGLNNRPWLEGGEACGRLPNKIAAMNVYAFEDKLGKVGRRNLLYHCCRRGIIFFSLRERRRNWYFISSSSLLFFSPYSWNEMARKNWIVLSFLFSASYWIDEGWFDGRESLSKFC